MSGTSVVIAVLAAAAFMSAGFALCCFLLLRVMKKSAKDEERQRLIDFWKQRYEHHSSVEGMRREPDRAAFCASADLEHYRKLIEKTKGA